MIFRNYCIVIMGDTEGALPEIAKVTYFKPKVLKSEGITICTFTSVANAKELEDYFTSLTRSFFLFQVGANNTGYNIRNKSIHDGLFSEIESGLNDLKKTSDKLMDDIQETFNTSGETKEIPTIDLKLTEVKVKGKSKIRKSYYENLNEEERAEKINEIIDKGYSNLSKLDKEVLELLKNIGKKG